MNVTQKNTQKGFTIIEVVLVLAIAALIFLMVFIALPALQRSQRDTQRKADVARVQTAIQNYQSNNRNALPSDDDFNKVLIPKYLTVNGSDSFADPNGNDYSFKSGTAPNEFDTKDSFMYFTRGAVCNGDSGPKVGQGQSKVAIQYKLEGGGTACVNN
ncbi:MAG TPA: type II secretion system protein [Candidatus Saccharimonadales bacterium]